MGQKHSRDIPLKLIERACLLMIVQHAIDEVDRDIEATDALFADILAGFEREVRRGRRKSEPRLDFVACRSVHYDGTRRLVSDVDLHDVGEKK